MVKIKYDLRGGPSPQNTRNVSNEIYHVSQHKTNTLPTIHPWTTERDTIKLIKASLLYRAYTRHIAMRKDDDELASRLNSNDRSYHANYYSFMQTRECTLRIANVARSRRNYRESEDKRALGILFLFCNWHKSRSLGSGVRCRVVSLNFAGIFP